MPGQQRQRGLRHGGEYELVVPPVAEPGVVVARRPAHGQLVQPGSLAPVALVGEARVLEPGALAVEEVETVGPPVEVAADAGLAAVGEFEALRTETPLKDFLPPVPPAPGAGLVQGCDPGGERVQHAQKGRVRRGFRDQQGANFPGTQEEASEAHLWWAGLLLQPCHRNPWLVDQIGRALGHVPPRGRTSPNGRRTSGAVREFMAADRLSGHLQSCRIGTPS